MARVGWVDRLAPHDVPPLGPLGRWGVGLVVFVLLLAVQEGRMRWKDLAEWVKTCLYRVGFLLLYYLVNMFSGWAVMVG